MAARRAMDKVRVDVRDILGEAPGAYHGTRVALVLDGAGEDGVYLCLTVAQARQLADSLTRAASVVAATPIRGETAT